MTLRVLDDLEQRSEEWFNIRRGIVTASAVAKLLTPTLKVADNDTSRRLTTELAAERITGWTEETAMTADMWRGVDHEPYARDKYAEHFAPVTEVGFMLRAEDMPWDASNLAYSVDEVTPTWKLGYSPDGLVGDDGLIEIKCPRPKAHVATILADDVPPQYVAQCQAGLLVSGRNWIDYVSYVAGMPLYVKRVWPDLDWTVAIHDACIAFETNAARIVADYEQRTADMPPTERLDFEIKVA